VRGTAARRGSTSRAAELGRKPRARARRRPLLGRAAGTRGPRWCSHPPPVSGSCGFPQTAVATVAGAPSHRPSAHSSMQKVYGQRGRVAQARKRRPAATTTTTTLPHRSKVSSLFRPLMAPRRRAFFGSMLRSLAARGGTAADMQCEGVFLFSCNNTPWRVRRHAGSKYCGQRSGMGACTDPAVPRAATACQQRPESSGSGGTPQHAREELVFGRYSS